MPDRPVSEQEIEAAARALHDREFGDVSYTECADYYREFARAALEAAAALDQPPADAKERCEDYDNDVTAVYHALSLPRCKNAAALTVDGRRVCFTHALLADLAAALHPPREGADEEIACTCGMEALHHDPHTLVGHLDACAKMQRSEENEEISESARESAPEDAYREIERLRSQVRCARAWFAQLADPANYPKDHDPAAYAQAFAAQVMGDMWVSAESSVEPTLSTTEAALAESRGEVTRLRVNLEYIGRGKDNCAAYARHALEAPHEST